MKKKVEKLSAVLLVLLLVFCMTACSSSKSGTNSTKETTSGGDKVTIRLAFPTWVGYTPLYIAKEKGFFEEYGLNVELTVIEGIAERKMAFAGGKLDGLAISADSLINLKAEGLDVKTVYMLDNSNGSDGIAAKAEIQSIEDLRGKTIAVEENMCEHFFLLKVLEQNGMSADDVNIVNMNTSDAGAAYVAGEVDACVVYEPYLSQCVEKGANTFTTKDYPVPLVDVIGFSADFMKENSQAITNFIKAIDEADQYWEANGDECAEICEAGLGISVEDCKFSKSVLSIYDLEYNISLMGKEDNPGEFYNIISDESEFYYNQGVISKEVDPYDFIDPSFVRELASE